MPKQLLVYESVAPLNRDAHRDLYLRQVEDFSFAATVSSVPLLDVEFARAAVEMPIVFARSGEGVVTCMALLSARRDHNSFVAEGGAWTGRHIPSFFRRYPFVFASEGDRYTLCFDEACPAFNTDGEGERLFDSTGRETSYARSVLQFVQEYQQTFERTQGFCRNLDEAGLLEDARIDYNLGPDQRGEVTGFLRISAEKLRGLDDATALRLFRSGELDLIQMHMVSLQTIEAVVSRLHAAKQGSADEAGTETTD